MTIMMITMAIMMTAMIMVTMMMMTTLMTLAIATKAAAARVVVVPAPPLTVGPLLVYRSSGHVGSRGATIFGSRGALKGGGDGDDADDDDADEAADCARKSVDAPVGMGEQYCGPIPFQSGGADAVLVLSDQ